VGYLESNYRGNAEQLPDALRGAIEIARQTAREQLVPLDDEGLRLVVTTTVCAHKFANRGDVVKALATLVPESRPAA
jgi:hypothetical protein